MFVERLLLSVESRVTIRVMSHARIFHINPFPPKTLLAVHQSSGAHN